LRGVLSFQLAVLSTPLSPAGPAGGYLSTAAVEGPGSSARVDCGAERRVRAGRIRPGSVSPSPIAVAATRLVGPPSVYREEKRIPTHPAVESGYLTMPGFVGSEQANSTPK
ncbi:hypothetical protein DFH09DRAFT_1198253, partial [Mycena vulgaris]